MSVDNLTRFRRTCVQENEQTCAKRAPTGKIATEELNAGDPPKRRWTRLVLA